MKQIQKHNLYNIRRCFEKRTGTRLLTTEDTYAEEVDRSSNQKSKQHPFKIVVPIILCVIVLAGCLLISLPQLHSLFDPNDSTGSNPSLSESQVPSGSENEEQLEGTKPTDSLNIGDYNMQIVRESNGKEITQTIVVDENHTLQIDAFVNTSNVQRISNYEYIPAAITDEQRTALFEAYFGDRADEVYHHTYGNANSWKLKNENEDYMFNYGREYGLIDAPLFCLRNANIQTSAFPKNMHLQFSDANISLDDAYAKCNFILPSLVENKLYEPDWVRPFPLPEATDDKGFYWITYRRIIDGMPITADVDLRFFVSENEVIRVVGVLYEIKELPFNQKIISAEDAFELIKTNVELINVHNLDSITRHYFSDTIPISEISLEYKVMRNENGYVISPIWRFVVGETDEQRMMYRDIIIAVNAVTGEIIIETRGLKM